MTDPLATLLHSMYCEQMGFGPETCVGPTNDGGCEGRAARLRDRGVTVGDAGRHSPYECAVEHRAQSLAGTHLYDDNCRLCAAPPRIDPERLEREIARWHRADPDTQGVTLAQFIARALAVPPPPRIDPEARIERLRKRLIRHHRDEHVTEWTCPSCKAVRLAADEGSAT